MSLASLHVQGEEAFSSLVPAGRERLAEMFRVAPDLAELAVGTVYGHLHHRPALDQRAREAVVLSALVASGMHGAPLAVHLRTALACGLSPGEIVEIVVQTAAFAGFPRAVSALPQIEESFREAGHPVPPAPTAREVVLDALDSARRPEATEPRDSPDWLGPLRVLAQLPHHPLVHTVGADEAVAVFRSTDAADAPAALALFRVDAGHITAAHLMYCPTPPRTGTEQVGGPSPSAALTRLLEDFRATSGGPAAAYLIHDEDLLDELQPLAPLLQQGAIPAVSDAGPCHATAVFAHHTDDPTVVLGHMRHGAIYRVLVMPPGAQSPDRAPAGTGPQ